MSESSERRQQILSAAERLVRHYGFGKTTVSDIAREARVGVGTVYLEFKSKEEILAEVSLMSHGAVLAAMREATLGEGSYAARLTQLLRQRVDNFLKFAGQGQHGLDLVHHGCAALRKVRDQFRNDEELMIAALLQQGDAAGEFSVSDPREIARVLLRIYDCFVPGPGTSRACAEIQAELEATHQLVLRGLLIRQK